MKRWALMWREYGRILIFGAPAFLFSSFYQVFVRNDKAPRVAMTAVVSGGVFNIILDYILIFPMKMGMAGAAAATVTGFGLNACDPADSPGFKRKYPAVCCRSKNRSGGGSCEKRYFQLFAGYVQWGCHIPI